MYVTNLLLCREGKWIEIMIRQINEEDSKAALKKVGKYMKALKII
jgi:hypothetical protein